MSQHRYHGYQRNNVNQEKTVVVTFVSMQKSNLEVYAESEFISLCKKDKWVKDDLEY